MARKQVDTKGIETKILRFPLVRTGRPDYRAYFNYRCNISRRALEGTTEEFRADCLSRHLGSVWGLVSKEVRQANAKAFEHNGQLVGIYPIHPTSAATRKKIVKREQFVIVVCDMSQDEGVPNALAERPNTSIYLLDEVRFVD